MIGIMVNIRHVRLGQKLMLEVGVVCKGITELLKGTSKNKQTEAVHNASMTLTIIK